MAKIILLFAFISSILVSSGSSWSKSRHELCTEYGEDMVEQLCDIPRTRYKLNRLLRGLGEETCGDVDYQDEKELRSFLNDFRNQMLARRRELPPVAKNIPINYIRINSESECKDYGEKVIIKLAQNTIQFLRSCNADLRCYYRWDRSVKNYFSQDVDF